MALKSLSNDQNKVDQLSSGEIVVKTLAVDSSGNPASGGDGAIQDGANSAIEATVFDYSNSNPLAVRLTNTDGDYVSAGAGTEYTEDVAAPADPAGSTFLMTRDDQLATVTEAEGDWSRPRGTSKGALWVALADSSGDPITSFGGGTQYTEDVAAAADPVGTALNLIRKDSLAALTSADGDNVAARGTDKGELYVKHVDTIAVTQSGTWDEVGINDSGNSITVDNAQLSVVGGGTEAAAMRVTIANDSTGVLSIDDNGGNISIDDGGNTITVDGTVAVTGVSTLAEQQTQTTALQLIDDVVYVDDTATHSTGTSKGVGIMAAATPTDASISANDIGMVAMTTDRKLHVAVMDALPAGTAYIGKILPPDRDVTLHTAYTKKYYTNAGAVTDGIVWSPAAGTRWHVVSMFINTSAAATITLEDDLAAGDSAVMKMELAANSGTVVNFSEHYPLASGEDAADLLVTTSAGNIYITLTGYEI